MHSRYGPTERLREQVEILLQEPDSTDIAVMSMLGEPAIPVLEQLLADMLNCDEETVPYERARKETAAVRVLGMFASDSSAPIIGRFLRTPTRSGRARDGQDLRIGVNALRKIGTDTALTELLSSIERLDLKHVLKALEAFGDKATTPVLDLMEDDDEDRWVLGAALATALKIPDAVIRLQLASDNFSKEHAVFATRLLAYFGPAAPLPWATEKAAGFESAVTRNLLAAGRAYGPTRMLDYEAILRVLYHGRDPSVVGALLPLIRVEYAAGIGEYNEIRHICAIALAVAFGGPAVHVLIEASKGQQNDSDITAAIERIQQLIKHETNYDKGHGYGSSIKRLFELNEAPFDEIRGRLR
jgi:hypothetical protein